MKEHLITRYTAKLKTAKEQYREAQKEWNEYTKYDRLLNQNKATQLEGTISAYEELLHYLHTSAELNDAPKL